MRSPIYTIEEIHSMPEFGSKVGWFYGLIWYQKDLHLGEIYPGLGFSVAIDRYTFYKPRIWKMIISDIWKATKR